MAKLRVHQVELAQQPGSRLRVHAVSLDQIAAVEPDLGPNRTVESQTLVSLSATIAGTVTAWSWMQTAGTTVTLTGSAGSRSFTAPATVDGDVLTFQVTATVDGVVSPPGTVSIVVRPHQWWVLRASGLKPFTLVVT